MYIRHSCLQYKHTSIILLKKFWCYMYGARWGKVKSWMSCDIIWHHVLWLLMSCDIMWYVMWHVLSCDVMWCVPPCVMSWCHLTLWRVMSCDIMCYVMWHVLDVMWQELLSLYCRISPWDGGLYLQSLLCSLLLFWVRIWLPLVPLPPPMYPPKWLPLHLHLWPVLGVGQPMPR